MVTWGGAVGSGLVVPSTVKSSMVTSGLPSMWNSARTMRGVVVRTSKGAVNALFGTGFGPSCPTSALLASNAFSVPFPVMPGRLPANKAMRAIGPVNVMRKGAGENASTLGAIERRIRLPECAFGC